jgi:TM2 domain-containing membrane protein YozV
MSLPRPHKNKTLATLLAAALGAAGVHRLYLRGGRDALLTMHLALLAASALLLLLAPGINLFYRLLPLIVSMIAGFLQALVLGVMADEKFDAAFNPGSEGRSDSRWPLALLLVATMLVGTTVLISTMARLFDLLYTGGAYG